MLAISPELIINLGETGINLITVGDFPPEMSRRVKRQMSATFADTLSGAFYC